jgi:hypothetical protein
MSQEMSTSCADRSGSSNQVQRVVFVLGAGFSKAICHTSQTQKMLRIKLLFLFSDAIAKILGESDNKVLADMYPEWLLRLVSAMHHTRATVITFNYNPLIECMVDTPIEILGTENRSNSTFNNVSWVELTGNLPPWAPGSFRIGAEQVETLRLLKLHGSLNW